VLAGGRVQLRVVSCGLDKYWLISRVGSVRHAAMSDLWKKRWTPISPQLDASGKNLVAIRNLYGPDVKAEPIPLSNAAPPQNDIDTHYSYTSMSLAVASSLSVGQYVDASVNFNQRIHSFDFAVGIFESFDAAVIPDDQIISGTFWGMAVRILLRVKALKADVSVEANVGPVGFASAVELGHAAVEFQADAVCSDPLVLAAMLEGVPLTGKFDIQAYNRFSGKLADAQAAMLASARADPSKLLPIGVMLRSKIDSQSFLDEAKSMRWALGQMAAGQNLASALGRVPPSVDTELVKELYRYKLDNNGQGPVDSDTASWARDQLR
jgi:hypothetical protein